MDPKSNLSHSIHAPDVKYAGKILIMTRWNNHVPQGCWPRKLEGEHHFHPIITLLVLGEKCASQSANSPRYVP